MKTAAKKPRQPKLPLVAEGEAPRLTIRARLISFLKTGPKTSIEAGRELSRQGVALEPHLVTQHLYLLTRDRLTLKDDESGKYRLI